MLQGSFKAQYTSMYDYSAQQCFDKPDAFAAVIIFDYIRAGAGVDIQIEKPVYILLAENKNISLYFQNATNGETVLIGYDPTRDKSNATVLRYTNTKYEFVESMELTSKKFPSTATVEASVVKENLNTLLSAANMPVISEAPKQSGMSTADEIREYKALLDEGIITQEEFDAKKKQLLGL